MSRQPKGLQRYAPAELNERHKEALRRIALGQRQGDVAKDLGITARTISYAQNSEAGKAYLAELQTARDGVVTNIIKELERLAPQAVETLRDGLEGQLGGSAVDHIKLKAAESVLDRAGYGRVSKVDSRIAHAYFSPEDLAEAKRRAVAARIEIEHVKRKDSEI